MRQTHGVSNSDTKDYDLCECEKDRHGDKTKLSSSTLFFREETKTLTQQISILYLSDYETVHRDFGRVYEWA